MPPRKRQRLSPDVSAEPIPSTSPAATPISPSAASPAKSGIPAKPSTYWPIAQQIALFKSLIQHKPTGPHKHFHLISIARDLSRSLGYYVPVEEIRAKLAELYNLETLDLRENEYAFRSRDKRGDWLPEIYEEEFALPGEPRAHGTVEEDEDVVVDEEAIKEVWGTRNEDEAWFIDQVWKRRFAEDGEEDFDTKEDAKDETKDEVNASPAPSTAPSTGRKPGRPKRQTRLSEMQTSTPSKDAKDEDEAEEEDDDKAEDENDEEEKEGEPDEDETPNVRKSRRSSTRTIRRGRGTGRGG